MANSAMAALDGFDSFKLNHTFDSGGSTTTTPSPQIGWRRPQRARRQPGVRAPVAQAPRGRGGSGARARVGASTWQAGVCLAATCILAPAALLRGDALWGFSRQTARLLAGFVALPQMVGHQGLAYVVKYLSARQVAALTLLEPVGATALAALFFGEIPPRVACFGAALVTAGVFAAL